MHQPPKLKLPSYRLHKQSGQAIVTLPDLAGGRNDVLLGPHDSPESHAEYDRIIAEWQANRARAARKQSHPDISVNELLLAYWQHVEVYYRHPDGTPTSEQNNIRQALRRLRQLYGHTLAGEFSSLSYEAVRGKMIGDGLCRNRINNDMARIKRTFKWAASKKLVPTTVYVELTTVEGLRAGRSAARETEPVHPVAVAVVEATLPHLLPQVRAMVQLQLLTGMRPGEVIRMRGIDLETTGKVWLYRPGSDRGPHGVHKSAWRGKSRVVMLGPKAQEILRPWLRLVLEEYLFQPVEAVAIWREGQRKERKTPVQPSQACRKKARPKRKPGVRYTSRTYHTAIARGCNKGNQPHWHANQLRHTAGTIVRREADIDSARVILGHSSPDTTEIYAELDLNKAAQIMERLG